jgi:polyferredoxin
VVLVLICAALATSLALRAPFRVDVLRDRAALARQVDDGFVENVYRLQIMNATELHQQYKVTADGLPGLALREPVLAAVAPTEARWVSVTLRLPPEAAAAAKPGAHPVHFIIERQASPVDDARSEREKSTFVIPR